jgi:hypothetical protein
VALTKSQIITFIKNSSNSQRYQTSQQLTEKPMVPVQLSNVLHSNRSMSKPALHTEITADGDWIKTYTLAQKLLRF